MVEKNYRVFCAMRNIPVDDSLVEDDQEDGMEIDNNEVRNDKDGDDAGMDVDDDDTPEFFKQMAAEEESSTPAKTKSKKKKTRVAVIVRGKIQRVLGHTDLADKRAGKLDENDFLRLLYAFNQEGIHFS
jgi:18S rRNA (adenine1779-N6/adenine1780-N6)-dimethyltransferase